MTNPFARYVGGFENLLARGRALGAPDAYRPQLAALGAGAPVCMVFSPHPDDEAISGALPWRLRRHDGWRVINVAVTLGSKVERRAERWQELSRCCDFLGFDLVSASGEAQHGLERITPWTAASDPTYWGSSAARVARLIDAHQPLLIVCPHANDGHAAHIGTHLLVMDGLRGADKSLRPHLGFSEYWNTQSDPGLMVELDKSEVADLVAALSLHTGEVARNPYHLTLPAWFMDGVRRGAERVGAPAATAPDAPFASLYGWQRWENGACRPLPPRFWPSGAPARALFE